MKMALRQAAGSLLVVGVEGTELTPLERAWLKLVRPAGIILFRRNIETAKQTRALLAEAQRLCTPHAARFVDVEGGTVDRLRDALAPIAPVEAVARAARFPTEPGYGAIPGPQMRGTEGTPSSLAREHGTLIARAVKAFGFNSPLAPVLDLGLPASQKVLGNRCAGSSAAEVVAYARPFLAGLLSQGLAGCGKHFPGLGGGTLDSHLETPKIRRSWQQLWQEDLEPYRALKDELPMVMVSHAAYPLTKGKLRPASVSSFWVGELLRKRIGYRGVIMSDDLEMGGVANFMPIGEAGVEAVRVGSDMLLICHRAEPILEVYEALISEGEKSTAFGKLLAARARESERKRAKLFGAKMPAALSEKEFTALRAKILEFGERVALSERGQELG
ncbi:MAG TPA: beta-N-acetylhexosaminidase [Terracidiphilus sp.]|jgi:beta-N-acetylhexosaminidase